MHTGGVPDQNKEQCGREQELKNMFKRNQVMITALAIMIAVAGYLNFAWSCGFKVFLPTFRFDAIP